MNSDEKQKIRDKLIETTQHAGPDALPMHQRY